MFNYETQKTWNGWFCNNIKYLIVKEKYLVEISIFQEIMRIFSQVLADTLIKYSENGSPKPYWAFIFNGCLWDICSSSAWFNNNILFQNVCWWDCDIIISDKYDKLNSSYSNDKWEHGVKNNPISLFWGSFISKLDKSNEIQSTKYKMPIGFGNIL